MPFTQENCVVDIFDNLLIYGHNMKEGSMFGGEYFEMFKGLIGNIGLVSMTGGGSGAIGMGTLLWPVPGIALQTPPSEAGVDPLQYFNNYTTAW